MMHIKKIYTAFQININKPNKKTKTMDQIMKYSLGPVVGLKPVRHFFFVSLSHILKTFFCAFPESKEKNKYKIKRLEKYIIFQQI
jgi:hypothetical protein